MISILALILGLYLALCGIAGIVITAWGLYEDITGTYDRKFGRNFGRGFPAFFFVVALYTLPIVNLYLLWLIVSVYFTRRK